jgi:hypothetical protein
MLLMTTGDIVMSDRHRDHKDDQDQEQDQKQDQLQAQLQGQAQGQAQGQGQFQFAVQSVDSKVDSENKNENDNDNKNDNENKNENENENKNENKNEVKNEVDNDVDNKLDNKVENSVENKIENKVDVEVDVKVDLDLSAFDRPYDNDVIDIDEIKDIECSVVMPDVVNQTLTGNGNQFNIDQVNNLCDKDQLWNPEVKNDGKFEVDQKAEGGDNKFDDPKVDIKADDGNTFGDGLQATADGINSLEAFTQNIVMGANIQFNSIEMSVAGNDLTDDHSL